MNAGGRTTERVGEPTFVTMRSSYLSCDCMFDGMCELQRTKSLTVRRLKLVNGDDDCVQACLNLVSTLWPWRSAIRLT